MSTIARRTLLIVLALIVPILPFLIVGELPGERWLSAYDSNAMLFGIIGTVILASDVLLPIPSSIVGTLLGARLGFGYALISIWTGLMVGHLVGYATGYFLFYRFRNQLPSKPTMVALFLSRPVPVLAEAMTLAAGGSKLNITQFIVSCALGNAMYALALAGNGANFITGSVFGPGLIIAMLIPVMSWFVWKWLFKK